MITTEEYNIFAPARIVKTPILKLVATLLRAIYLNVAPWGENLFTWRFFRGKRNPQSEIEGPYYVIGAPLREIEPGKAVLVRKEQLKGEHRVLRLRVRQYDLKLDLLENQPFLFTGRVTTTDGAPIAGALVDIWQVSIHSFHPRCSPSYIPPLHDNMLTLSTGRHQLRILHRILHPPRKTTHRHQRQLRDPHRRPRRLPRPRRPLPLHHLPSRRFSKRTISSNYAGVCLQWE